MNNMNKKGRKFPALLTAMLLIASQWAVAWAAEPLSASAVWEGELALRVDRAMADTGTLLLRQVPEPAIGSIGGEWMLLGLAAGGQPIPEEVRRGYLERVNRQMAESGGVLSRTKYTEYARLILALTALGQDVRRVGGYDLLEKLGDLSLLKKQGINGPVYALIALDSHGYPAPGSPGAAEPATREALLSWILAQELADPGGIRGGFNLTGQGAPDPDMTAMVLQAIAPYRADPAAEQVVQRGLAALERMETPGGGFASRGVETSESLAQVIVAKSALGLDASAHVEALLKYYKPGGGFEHVLGDGGNPLATEQGLYALAAYKLAVTEGRSLYDMKHVTIAGALREIRVELNGQEVSFDQPPINRNSRVLVPFRALFEAFGAKVSWDGSRQEVIGVLADREVWLRIGSPIARVRGTAVSLDVPAVIENGRTLVPVRFVAESLNAEVAWDESRQLVRITTK